jgi:tRNA-dihydrouridine synthase
MSCTLLSSPLQGLTDFRFRTAFNRYFGGIDTFYAPYFRLHGKREIKPAYERDLLPANNAGIKLIPQIVTRDAEEFVFAAGYVQKLDYKELNWNLGCPYPMIAKRGMGSGLLKEPEKIESILDRVHAESDIRVSIKTRLGYASREEIFKVLPILNKYPLKNIAIHPRIGKQIYTGELDVDAFQRCVDSTDHSVCFNGGITTVTIFNDLVKRFPMIEHWMIGRGMIADPFLPDMIKKNITEYPENRMEVFGKFHDTLFNEYAQALSGPGHVIMKMRQFWEYFTAAFPQAGKRLKKIKKAKTISAYEEAVREILHNEGEKQLIVS